MLRRLYADTFESRRRIKPRLWDVDYCLLHGLRNEVAKCVRENVNGSSTIVDLGCGAKPYRPLFPNECEYIGVDACDNPHADYVVSPGDEIPLEDNSADLILSTQVIYLIPEFQDYLAQIQRLLKPNGSLFISTHGTWTHHPASGGDYYRFTQDGLRYILEQHGLEVAQMVPVVGTLGTGLHLRQLVINSWLRRLRLSWIAAALNVFTNLRIKIEDAVSPYGTRMSSPVIIACLARPVSKGAAA